MIRTGLAFAAVALAAPAASAEVVQTLYGGDGHLYEQSCTDSGYVLTSKYPFAVLEGTGAATQFLEKNIAVYLGRDCDAFSDFYGAGQWCWANGGTIVEFERTRLPFARQTPSCPSDDAIKAKCGC